MANYNAEYLSKVEEAAAQEVDSALLKQAELDALESLAKEQSSKPDIEPEDDSDTEIDQTKVHKPVIAFKKRK